MALSSTQSLPVFGAPSTTPPKAVKALIQRPAFAKLSLSIPATTQSSDPLTQDCGQTPAPSVKIAATPIRQSRPKLSLNLPSALSTTEETAEPRRPSLSLQTALPKDIRIPAARETDEEEDLTARNTLANQNMTSEACGAAASSSYMDCDDMMPSYTILPGVKPILKKGGRSSSMASSATSESSSVNFSLSSSISSFSSTFSLAKSVSFESSPAYIPQAYYVDEDEEENDFHLVNSSGDESMSPPSTTSSSTDSDESESDNECKTPVDNTQSGWMTKRFADKPGYGGGGRWKKAKREWVWTLGECSSVEPSGMGYSDNTKVWVAV